MQGGAHLIGRDVLALRCDVPGPVQQVLPRDADVVEQSEPAGDQHRRRDALRRPAQEERPSEDQHRSVRRRDSLRRHRWTWNPQ